MEAKGARIHNASAPQAATSVMVMPSKMEAVMGSLSGRGRQSMAGLDLNRQLRRGMSTRIPSGQRVAVGRHGTDNAAQAARVLAGSIMNAPGLWPAVLFWRAV
ncbi:hypothetical protein D3C73_1190350 [compost metagenome]